MAFATPMTKAQLEAGFLAWFLAASGMSALRVRYAKDGGPMSERPCAVLYLVAPGLVTGTDEIEPPRDEGGGQIYALHVGHRRATASVQTFGVGAVDTLMQVKRRHLWNRVQHVADTYGLSVVMVSGVADITGLVDATNFEERAKIDILIGYMDNEDERLDDVAGGGVGVIDTLEADGTLYQPSGTVVDTLEIDETQ